MPQVEKIVRAVTEKGMEILESRPNFFELFGFDFAVDSNLKLWLIEINMSPACAERQPWLTTMLDDMADGVSGIISAKINSTDVEQGCAGTQWYMMQHKSHFFIDVEGKKVRVKIPQSNQNDHKMLTQQHQLQSNLDIVGRQVNMKVENFLDKMSQRVAAALFIQKMYKGFKTRNKFVSK